MPPDKHVTGRNRHVLRYLSFNSEIRLVRISVFKVFADGQRERQNGAEAGEGLIVETLSPELILRASCQARCSKTWSTEWSAGAQRPLKDLRGIQQNGQTGDWIDWERSTDWRQNSLLLLHSIGNVGIESDGEKRMIVEHSCGCANHRSTITAHVPGQAEAWRPIVFISREALLHSHRVLGPEQIVSRQSDAGQWIAKWKRGHLLRQLNVVTDAVVKRQVRTNFPGVLHKRSQGFVADAAYGITKTLNVVFRNAESISLHGCEIRWRRQTGRAKRGYRPASRKTAEVVETGKVQFEDRFRNSDKSRVASEFQRVVSHDPIKVVGPVVTRLGALHWRKQLAPDERGTGNIKSDRVAIL